MTIAKTIFAGAALAASAFAVSACVSDGYYGDPYRYRDGYNRGYHHRDHDRYDRGRRGDGRYDEGRHHRRHDRDGRRCHDYDGDCH